MNIVAIGAHPDDVELGAGGALARHKAAGDRITIITLTAGEQGGAPADVRVREAEAAARVLGAEYINLGFKDTAIPSTSEPLFALEECIKKCAPDRVYIPFQHEIHQDHRRTFEVAISACRNVPQILMYEGPSTFPDFKVDFWIDIKDHIKAKLKAIECHASQGEKEILKLEAVQGLNRARGYQARTQYAEGFAIFRFIE